MKLKKEVRKQLKKVGKQAEKLYRDFGEGESPAEYDTNTVLIRMDKLENEIKALREAVNLDKKEQYLEKIGQPDEQPGRLTGAGRYVVKSPKQ